jgi:O-acetyl-ADP-ribose deacetylase (regulator of RNase III)
MPLQIIRADLTKVRADAIVNSANPEPIVGDGVDEALHRVAGPKLLEERKLIGSLLPGECYPTPAFDLPAKWVIHTVGPLWEDGTADEIETLAECYAGALWWAKRLECQSIAFPLISTGTLGFPKDKALQIAADVIRHHLAQSDMLVLLVVYDPASFVYSEALLGDVEVRMSHIDKLMSRRFVLPFARHIPSLPSRPEGLYRRESIPSPATGKNFEKVEVSFKASMLKAHDVEPSSLTGSFAMFDQLRMQDRHEPRTESFAVRLFEWIEARKMTNAECYRRANIDKKLFAKINANIHYQPKKVTALAFCVALRLDLEETQDLIGRAGYCLSSAIRFDLIVMDFIRRKHYDVIDINIALYDQGLPPLGSK